MDPSREQRPPSTTYAYPESSRPIPPLPSAYAPLSPSSSRIVADASTDLNTQIFGESAVASDENKKWTLAEIGALASRTKGVQFDAVVSGALVGTVVGFLVRRNTRFSNAAVAIGIVSGTYTAYLLSRSNSAKEIRRLDQSRQTGQWSSTL